MAEVFLNHATELATVSNTFSVDGTATDPTTISLVITDPTGSSTTYTYAATEITRTGTGAYRKDISCASTVAGIWTAVWVGTGTAADVATTTWTTFDEDAKLYCTPEELRSRLSVPSGTTTLDLEIRMACEAASRAVDEHCGRRFWRGAETRTFVPRHWYRCDIDDLVSLTALATDASGDGTFETSWSAGQYQLLPVNPAAFTETRPYTSIRAVGGRTFPVAYGCPTLTREDRVQVQGVFGWPAVPHAVKQAALTMAAELLKLKDAPFGVAGFDAYGPVRVRDNPIVARLLAPYQRADTAFLVA